MVARNLFENHQELFQNAKKQKKKADFLRNFKCKHNLLLDLPERSHKNLAMFYLSTYIYIYFLFNNDERQAGA